MSISIAIPCLNGESRLAHLFAALRELRQLQLHSDDISLYFSDNNSDDESLSYALANSSLFDDVFTSERTIPYDLHLIELARKVRGHFLFFLGVNYILNPSEFLNQCRYLASAEPLPDLISAFCGEYITFSGIANSDTFYRSVSQYVGGISGFIYKRSTFVSSSLFHYCISNSWFEGQTAWVHSVAVLSVVTNPNSGIYIASSNLVSVNPASSALLKTWFSPPDRPIYYRISFLRIVVDHVPWRHVNHCIGYWYFDPSVFMLSFRLVSFKSLFPLISYTCNTLPLKFLPRVILPLLGGFCLSPLRRLSLSLVRSFQILKNKCLLFD